MISPASFQNPMTCGSTGRFAWTTITGGPGPGLPTCARRVDSSPCPAPPITGGTYSFPATYQQITHDLGYNHGTQVGYTCSPGYTATDPTAGGTMLCQHGLLSGQGRDPLTHQGMTITASTACSPAPPPYVPPPPPAPTCYPPTLVPAAGQLIPAQSSYDVNMHVTVACQAGYRLSPPTAGNGGGSSSITQITCGANGQFTPAGISCVRASVTCPRPANLVAGTAFLRPAQSTCERAQDTAFALCSHGLCVEDGNRRPARLFSALRCISRRNV